MKFLFVTDTHFRDDRPKTRTDDILKAQFDKLGQIIELVREESIDAVLHGGDFFNTKKPSHKLLVDIIDWCKQLEIPVFSIKGNHDLVGYNLDSVRNSGLGVLFESGAVDLLSEEVFETAKVVIKAVHTSLNFEQDYMFDEKYNDYTRIIISHNFIIPSESMPFGFIHPRDIKTNAHLVLCGHYHQPFDYSTETTRWINPGTLCRWKISEKDHKPRVLIVEAGFGKYTLEEVYLKVTPGDQVFDIEAVEVDKQYKKDIDTFAKSLEQTSFSNLDIEQVVKQVGQDQKIDPDIVEECVKRLRQAKEILK